MASKTSFKHSPSATWRRVEKEGIVLDLDTSSYYSLNEVGAFIWESLGSGKSPEEVASLLCEEYEVAPAAAAKDIADFVRALRKDGLLVEA